MGKLKLKTPIRYDMNSQRFFDADNNHIMDMRGFRWLKDGEKQDELAYQIVGMINSCENIKK